MKAGAGYINHNPTLRVRTNVKAGGGYLNHNPTLRVRTNVKAGAGYVNHNAALRVRTNVKAGAGYMNHNATVRVRSAVRAGTVGTRAPVVQGLVDLLLERAALARGESVAEAAVGDLPAFPSVTPPGCCLRRHEEPSGIPALCSEDMHQ